jgi:hypothetical protein
VPLSEESTEKHVEVIETILVDEDEDDFDDDPQAELTADSDQGRSDD